MYVSLYYLIPDTRTQTQIEVKFTGGDIYWG